MNSINPCPVDSGANGFSKLCGLNFNGNVVGNVLTIGFIIAILIALAFLIFGGIKWITSGGDKAGVEEARNMIVAALVGLVVTFLSYFIINILLQFFGLGGIGALTLPTIFN